MKKQLSSIVFTAFSSAAIVGCLPENVSAPDTESSSDLVTLAPASAVRFDINSYTETTDPALQDSYEGQWVMILNENSDDYADAEWREICVIEEVSLNNYSGCLGDFTINSGMATSVGPYCEIKFSSFTRGEMYCLSDESRYETKAELKKINNLNHNIVTVDDGSGNGAQSSTDFIETGYFRWVDSSNTANQHDFVSFAVGWMYIQKRENIQGSLDYYGGIGDAGSENKFSFTVDIDNPLNVVVTIMPDDPVYPSGSMTTHF